MKIIILEGIATSGKTSVKNELTKILDIRGFEHLFVDEDETLMPVLNNKDPEVSARYLESVLTKYLAHPKSVIIFDRFYLSHIWRTGGDLAKFETCTNLLLREKAKICFLEIPGDKIPERIQLAVSHRDQQWNDYVKTRGNTQGEVNNYYLKQQESLLNLLKIIAVPHHIFDTGDMDFVRVAEKINSLIT